MTLSHFYWMRLELDGILGKMGLTLTFAVTLSDPWLRNLRAAYPNPCLQYTHHGLPRTLQFSSFPSTLPPFLFPSPPSFLLSLKSELLVQEGAVWGKQTQAKTTDQSVEF